MKRIGIVLLSLCLLLTLCVGCAETPADDSSDAVSEAVSETESAGDVTPGDESTGDAATESSDEGGLLLGTTTASDSTTTDGSKNTTDKNATTTKKNSGTDKTVATQKPITRPSNAPTIASTTTKKEIKLPEYDLDYTKSIKICIDWDPKSTWVQSWEKAFHALYDPDEEIKVNYVQAAPSMKASKLAVWKSANQSPDAIYIKANESWPDLVDKGLTQPVDSMVDLNTGFWEGTKATMDQLKINGKTHALIVGANPRGWVIYNPKVFKNAGLTDPRDLFYKDEWTFSKFEEYAKKLTRVNATDSTKNTYGVYFHYWEAIWLSGGIDLVEYQNGKWVSNMNNKTITDILEFMRKLGPTGNKYVYMEGADMSAVRNLTVSGQIGMFVTREDATLEFTNGELANDTLRCVPTPRYDSCKEHYVGGSIEGWYICNGAKNPLGGLAYASAIRASMLWDLELEDDEEDTEDSANKVTPEQSYCYDYAASVLSVVPQPFGRVEGSGTLMYWDFWGPVVRGEKSWSAVVAELEPQVLEILNKG